MPRTMEITTPLGEDVLLFLGMHAHEELGRLSDFQVDLLSTRNDINLDEILGQNVTVRLALSDENTRYFNGYVTRFGQYGTYGRYHRYSATVRPWLWFLTRTADCRIFQDKTVPDILREVFADHSMADTAFDLTGSYRQWTYCVQYRETDFDFVSRLMEQEGIYYYFRHTDGHDTLVLTDSTSRHPTAPGHARIQFVAPEQTTRPEAEYVTGWSLAREIQPGLYVHDDYDFERPSVELQTRRPLPRNYTPSDYEVYDYPGEYVQTSDGDQYARVRMDEIGTQFETAEAVTTCRGLGVGHLFTLEDHPRTDQNREHLVIAASYDLRFGGYEGLPEGEGGASFSCTFTAMSSQQQFRPARTTRKPVVQGPQTAVVVGPSGEEIYTDEYGRVKVQFHWDRRGQRNENSSCWMRVSHPWAGKNWGAIATPRIGQEVIVDFLEGDPDQPIVTGRVYNQEQMPPYDLPANKTQTGIKSRSSTNGTPANFNEIRFEDKKGSEQVYIHAEKNQDIVVEVDETHFVGRDRKKTIRRDETTVIERHRTETVQVNETITIGGNREEQVAGDETITINGHRSEAVDGGEDVRVTGARKHTVDGPQATLIAETEDHLVRGTRRRIVNGDEEITIDGTQSVSVGGMHQVLANSIHESTKSVVTIIAGTVATIKARVIALKAGGSVVTIDDSGITIKGAKITLTGKGGINLRAPTIGEN